MSEPAAPLTASEAGRRGGSRGTPAQLAARQRNLLSAFYRRDRRRRELAAEVERLAPPEGATAEEQLAAGRAMLLAGVSLAAVGRRLDLSRERVRQVLGEFAAECREARKRGRTTPASVKRGRQCG